jgi:hypothetical protein
LDKLKQYFHEIILGHSRVESNYGPIFIKHFTSFDIGNFDYHLNYYHNLAVKQGLPTFEDKEQEIIKEGLWSVEKNMEIKSLGDYLSNLNTTKSKAHVPAHIAAIDKQIKEAKDKLQTLNREKNEHMFITAETFANKKINELYILHAIFKDFYLKETLLTPEQFDELSDQDLSELVIIYNDVTSRFCDANIKKIALHTSFTNLFYLAEDNVYEFYGKPIVNLSFFQVQLFSYGRYFKSLLSNAKAKPPEDVMQDPDRLIEWCGLSQNANKALERQQTNSNVKVARRSIPGMTQNEMKEMGLAVEDGPDLFAEAAKNGGELSMDQILKLKKLR